MVKWIVEDGPFAEDLTPLIEEIKRQQHEVFVVKYAPFESGKYDQADKDDCVICYGSINLIRQIQRTKPWIPGTWCNFANMECRRYYAHWGKYVLNSQAFLLPLGEVIRRGLQLFVDFGQDSLFIRPNSGTKSFVGHVISALDLESNLRALSAYNDQEELVLLAPVKNISDEWRFVIGDRKLIACFLYKLDGNTDTESFGIQLDCPPREARELAEKIAEEIWQPDPIYTIDICGHLSTKARCKTYHLLEVNSFSCSGFYGCNPRSIVREASRLAINEWKDINEDGLDSQGAGHLIGNQEHP